jgi:hypothetical protein
VAKKQKPPEPTRCSSCGDSAPFERAEYAAGFGWEDRTGGWVCSDCYELFYFHPRRSNPYFWEWEMSNRRREVQDTVFAWIRNYSAADDHSRSELRIGAFSGKPNADDWTRENRPWAVRTRRELRRWAMPGGNLRALKKAHTVVAKLYDFEDYCYWYFRDNRKPPVIPPYPRFSTFVKSGHRRVSGKRRDSH